MTRQTEGRAGPYSVSVPHATNPLALIRSAISISLRSVTILQSTGPSALVPGRGGGRLSDTVPTLVSLAPFAPIDPPSSRLHSQTVSLSILPLSLVSRATRPGVNSGDLEPVMPATRISSLSLRPGTNSVPVRLPVFPTAAVSAAIVEIESTAVHLRAIGRRRGGTCRSRLGRAYATCLRQLGTTCHPVRRPGLLLLLPGLRMLLHLS